MLVACTDGVGTKLLLARELGRHRRPGAGSGGDVRQRPRCAGARPLVSWTTWPWDGSTPRRRRRWSPASPAPAPRSAAPCSAARPPRCPASTRRGTSTWPGSPAASSSGTTCWAPTACARATPSLASRPRASTPTASRWCGRSVAEGPLDRRRRPAAGADPPLRGRRRRPRGGGGAGPRRPRTSPAGAFRRTCRVRCPDGLGPTLARRFVGARGRPSRQCSPPAGCRPRRPGSAFDMGLGMCVVVDKSGVGAALAALPDGRLVGRVEGLAGVRRG